MSANTNTRGTDGTPTVDVASGDAREAAQLQVAREPNDHTVDGQACCTADAPHGGNHPDPGYISEKDKYLARLRRIEGQVRGVHRMVDEGKYCIDILTQISALNSALENVALGLLEDHLAHCVADAARTGGDVADAKLAEATQAIRRLVKS